MTLQIPDDLAASLERQAFAQSKTVDQLALENLRLMLDEVTHETLNDSPQALLHRLRLVPHASAEAVHDLEASIAAGKLPVRPGGIFDEPVAL